MRARFYRACVPIFINYNARVSASGNDSPAALTLCASPIIPMKNTSLLVLLGNAKRTPAAATP